MVVALPVIGLALIILVVPIGAVVMGDKPPSSASVSPKVLVRLFTLALRLKPSAILKEAKALI